MKTALIIIYILVAFAVIVLSLMQSSSDEGASAAVTGGSSSFYEKNKGRTKEGLLKRGTIILGIIFVILAVTLGIVY